MEHGEVLLPPAKLDNLRKRAKVVKSLRRFFWERGFVEVETPIVTNEPAPEVHIEPVACEMGWLITSPELHMKRLIASGMDKIFQITRVFRKNERGKRHLPEFTILEWYRVEENYEALMDDCCDLICFVASEVGLPSPFLYGNIELTYHNGIVRMTVEEAFVRWAGWSPITCQDAERFYVDLVEKVEPHLGVPTPLVLKDYPTSESALARLKDMDSRVCERFELYWAGIELANGFSELTDPDEQRLRFNKVLSLRQHYALPPLPMPEAFLTALSGFPSCAGIALGVDRLVMILTGAIAIDDVVAFPGGML